MGLPFDPRFVSAVLKKDETEILKYSRQGLFYPLGGMGVVVAMDRHYRAVDSPPHLQQFAALPHPGGLPPDLSVYVQRKIYLRRFLGERVKGVGPEEKLTQPGELIVATFRGPVAEGFQEPVDL